MGNTASIPYADRELASASEKGNLPRAKFLVEKDGANVNFQDAYGWSPLLHAISEGHLDVIKFLLAKGATTTHITSDRANAVHHAVTSQNESVLLFILQYGTCDVNAKNDGGWTPLHLACLSNQYQLVKLLLSFKADPSLVNGEGKTAAQITTTSSIRALIENGPGKLEDITPDEEDLHTSKGMQKSLQQLQTLQHQPKTPLEMKGYIYLSDSHDSSEDLTSISTSSNYNNEKNNQNNNNNNNYNNNNNNNNNNNIQNNNSQRGVSRSASGLIERETQRIFEAIGVLRGIDPDELNLMQVQELIDFHHSEMQKYIQAKKLMDEIRAKQLELMLA